MQDGRATKLDAPRTYRGKYSQTTVDALLDTILIHTTTRTS